MKTLNISAALLFSLFTINISFAQTDVKKESIKVWGNCGMCKSKIEKSAKSAGATSVSWSEETKILNVGYIPSNSSGEKIEKAIAASGYDTQNFKGDDKAYNGLHGCCKYERNTAYGALNTKSSSTLGCTDMACCKGNACCDTNGKCNTEECKTAAKCKDMKCCKS